MQTELKTYTVRQVIDGFVYNELEGKGLFGLSGNLVIQPEYQRNYIYAENNKEADVIDSLLNDYPLGLLYFEDVGKGMFQVLDGQQRITSIGRFVTRKFAILDKDKNEQYIDSLPVDEQEKILNSTLLVYHCKGSEKEIKNWFKTINIAGIPLNNQELLNSIYSGSFVTLAKAEFSNSKNADTQKWSFYIKGSARRQDFLATALKWIADSKGQTVEDYMAMHRHDTAIDELKTYFNTVIDWVSGVFPEPKDEMRGLEWGQLYETYHKKSFNPTTVSERVKALYGDPYVKNRRGIYEYILGDEIDKKLLDIRVFDEATKKIVYARQTEEAQKNGVSNCPLCAVSDDANKTRIWSLDEMDADHVAAWSKGGATSIDNCQLLCKTHNRAKGNK
jgi:hypothetical protein